MKRFFLLFSVLAFMGAGCINVDVDLGPDGTDEQAPVEVSGTSPAVAPETEEEPDGQLTIPRPSENIRVFEPLMRQVVGSKFVVVGEARVFEQTFNWRLTDTASGADVEGVEQTSAADIGVFGPFSFQVDVPVAFGSALMLEVFEYSAQNGAEINKVEVPLIRN